MKSKCYMTFLHLQPPHNKTVFAISDDSGKSRNFFMIDEDSGSLSLKRSLLDDREEKYEVGFINYIYLLLIINL